MLNFLKRFFQPNLFPGEAFTKHSLLTWDEGSAQAGIVRLNNGSAELLGVATSLVNGLRRDGNPDMERWLTGSDQALSQAEEMTNMSGTRKLVPDHVALGVPANLVQSVPLTVTRNRRGQNEPISRIEVQALLERGFRQAQDLLELQDTKSEIIHGVVGQFALDGQPIQEPLGLHGSELDASFCFSVIPIEWLRAAEKLAQQLYLHLTLIIPEQVALAAPLRDGMSWLIILDRHHSVIALVNAGCALWSAKIAFGERDILSEIGKIMAMQGREVDVLMRTYREGRLADDAESRLSRAFWFQLRRWMVALAQEAGKALTNNRPVPSAVYWLDQTGMMPETRDALQTETFANLLPFANPPEILTMNLGSVRDVLDCTAQANSSSYLMIRSMAFTLAQASAAGNNWNRSLLQIVRGRRFDRR